MTLQSVLQIALTLLIGALISIPVGRYLARVVSHRQTILDPVFDPIDNFIYLLIGKQICTRTDGLEGLYDPYVGDQSLYGDHHISDSRAPGSLAPQPSAFCRRGAAAGVQYRDQLHHQHRLAGLWRRDLTFDSQSDGGDHLSDVHLRSDRLRCRDGLYSRLHHQERWCRSR